MSRARPEEGAATVLVAALLGVTALLTAGVGRLGGAAVERSRADAVADLVALAAVSGQGHDAYRVAERTGAHVVRLTVEPTGRAVVVVRVGSATAVAAAAPGRPVIPG